jgi:hypothetical protein
MESTVAGPGESVLLVHRDAGILRLTAACPDGLATSAVQKSFAPESLVRHLRTTLEAPPEQPQTALQR